jgi:photosystem II stability/assembly factor-like uncharacterized protein
MKDVQQSEARAFPREKNFLFQVFYTVPLFIGGMLVSVTLKAQSWNGSDAPNQLWQAVACSADGQKMVAAVNDGGIYTSTNGGTKWTITSAPLTNWFAVASSANGNRLVAAVNYYIGYSPIYLSTDGGLTWNPTTAPSYGLNWRSLASSGDGKVLAAASYGYIYVSTNYGSTWIKTSAASHQWTGIAMSGNGSSIAACIAGTSGTGVYVSTNFGGTWNLGGAPTTNSWQSIAVSADGSQIIAVAWQKPIYRSSDGGVTWNSINPYSDSFVSVACTGVTSGGLYVYKNSGSNELFFSYPAVYWRAVASSADGGRLAGVVQNGGIYTVTPSSINPFLSFVHTGNQTAVFWTIPSKPFQLVQNSDLNTTNWNSTSAVPTLMSNNFAYQVMLDTTQAANYFRLKAN